MAYSVTFCDGLNYFASQDALLYVPRGDLIAILPIIEKHINRKSEPFKSSAYGYIENLETYLLQSDVRIIHIDKT